MSEEDFVAAMRVEFRVWEGTKNADDILTDVVAIIGSRHFNKHGMDLRRLEAKCGSRQARVALYNADAVEEDNS